MKKFFYILLCLLLIAGIGGSAVVLAKSLNNDTNIEQPNGDDSGDNSTNSGNGQVDDTPDVGDSGNGSGTGDTEEPKVEVPLTAPSNQSTLIAEGMQMLGGAQVYFGDDESLDPAIRFTCLIENTLKDELEADENKTAAILVAPLDYFNAVNTENYTVIDWNKAFEDAGKTVLLTEYTGYGEYDSDTSYIRFTLANVLYQNMYRKFVAIGCVIDNSGSSPTYKYASMPNGQTYRSNARSVAYVSAAALNANATGESTLTAENAAKLKSYVNMAVDYANGLEEPTEDNSTFTLNVTPTGPKTISVGEKFKVNADYTLSDKIEVPIWYRSTDFTIATVDSEGNVTALKAGTTVIGVYVAGEAFGITINVV